MYSHQYWHGCPCNANSQVEWLRLVELAMVCFPVAVYDVVGGDLLSRDEAN